MAYDQNEIIIIGRVTHDPDLKYSSSGTMYVRLNIVSNSKQGDGSEKANYFKVMVFGNRAENCYKYLQKGSQVCISGSMQMSDYEDENGKKIRSWIILSNHIQFLNKLKEQTPLEEEDNPLMDEEDAIPILGG